jgi:HD-GYP domain-containing protein (c-di-GMP phosphodiesterase class II)
MGSSGGFGLSHTCSVRLAVWLQDRDRDRRSADELQNQFIAIIAIADRCAATLKDFDERLREHKITKLSLRWLADEAEAIESAAAAINLMSIRSPNLINEVAELQEATHSGRRRMGYVNNDVRKNRIPKIGHFDGPLKKAEAALANICAIQK